MLSRYCSVSDVLSALVAAAAIVCPTTVSAMPRICEVCTVISAGLIWFASVLENEVARAEKLGGMVTTAA